MKPLSRLASALVRRARPTLLSQRPSHSPWRCGASSHRTFKTETLYKTNSGKMTEPLRILFCGSDNVSTESLHALHEEYVHNRELVESIDVCVLPPKLGGRGMKQKIIIPVERAADALDLDYHEISTFTDWDMPSKINLIIAVSFGLFVPPRLLRQAKYGGLNVHPSFLPDLRGPAPIHQAILRGDSHVGASLQTLDEQKFDHGTILAQTPAPGLRLLPHSSMNRTTRKLAMECAELLVQGLRDGVHVQPHEDVGWKAKDMEEKGEKLVHAPKIMPADLEIDWINWTEDDWVKRLRIKQAIWTMGMAEVPDKTLKHSKKNQPRRLIFHDARPVPREEVKGFKATMEVLTLKEGEDDPIYFRKLISVDSKPGHVYIMLYGDRWVKCTKATLEGKPEKPAAHAVKPFVVQFADSKMAPKKNANYVGDSWKLENKSYKRGEV